MPYDVGKDDRCPASKPWAVTKESDGTLLGCHATEDDAQDQRIAILINEGLDR